MEQKQSNMVIQPVICPGNFIISERFTSEDTNKAQYLFRNLRKLYHSSKSIISFGDAT
jgi:hypothetical protein